MNSPSKNSHRDKFTNLPLIRHKKKHAIWLIHCSLGKNDLSPGCHVYPFTFQIPVQWVFFWTKLFPLVFHINIFKHVSLFSVTISFHLSFIAPFVATSYRDLPSSFKGSCGKILYTVEANLNRSMRMDSKAKAEFTLIQKTNHDPVMMVPLHCCWTNTHMHTQIF